MKEFDSLGAAHAGAAIHDGFTVRIEFAEPFGQVIERYEVPTDVASYVLIGLAYIEDEDVVVRVESLFEVFCMDPWNLGQFITSAAVAACGGLVI